MALPHSISDAERQKLAEQIAQKAAAEWDVPAMFAVHRPDKKGDQRNDHMHLILGTRDSKGAKVRRIVVQPDSVESIRWLRAMASAQIEAAVPAAERGEWDHRSFADQGVNGVATHHEGPMVRGLSRQGVQFGRAQANAEIVSLAKEHEATVAAQKSIYAKTQPPTLRSGTPASVLAEHGRATLERIGKLAQSAAQIGRKIVRFSPEQIRCLDDEARRHDRAHELARGAGGRLGEAVRLNALKKHDLHGELQRGGSGVPETAESLRRNEDRIPRIVLPDFDLTAIALMLDRKKMRKGGLMPISTPKNKADLDFISRHISGQPEEYDPKKHGPLLPEDRPKNRGHGPSL